MYAQVASGAADQVDDVKRILSTNECLRTLLFSETDQPDCPDPFTSLRKLCPSEQRWRVFEHCAVVTRLYAIFERCISDLVRGWVAELPALVPAYESLGTAFASAHRFGVAHIIKNLDQDRFRGKSAAVVSGEFSKAVSGESPFIIEADAFLHLNQTLKHERIAELLTQVCIRDGWTWLASHGAIAHYLKNTGGDQTTCDAELRTFISYRNDAAHGNVDQVLGISSLSDYSDFIAALCTALGEQFEWNRLQLLRQHGSVIPIGKVTEVFKKSNAVVAVVSGASISVGDTLALAGPRNYRNSVVLSLMDQDKATDRVDVKAERELGFTFDWMPPRNTEIFCLAGHASESRMTQATQGDSSTSKSADGE